MMGAKTRLTIFIAAIISGLLNYAGLTQGVAPDDWWLKALCAGTGLVVTLSLSLFWTYAFTTVPELSLGRARISGWITTVFGVIMIIAMSTYWNLVTLAGGTISQEMSKGLVSEAELLLAQAAVAGTAYQSYTTDLNGLLGTSKAIRQREIEGTGLSPTAGEGSISDAMGLGVDAIANIVSSVSDASNGLSQLQANGEACLSDLRRHAAAGDMGAAGKSLACINRTVSQIAGQDVLSSMERSLRNLASGVVLPSGIRTKKQRAIVAGFLTSRQDQAARIADQIAAEVPVVLSPLTMERPNLMRGVLLHWASIIPAIFTALAIDLLPLVLLIYRTLRADDQGTKGKPKMVWTASELQDALRQIEALRGEDRANPDLPPPYVDLPDSEWHDEGDATGDDEPEEDK